MFILFKFFRLPLVSFLYNKYLSLGEQYDSLISFVSVLYSNVTVVSEEILSGDYNDVL